MVQKSCGHQLTLVVHPILHPKWCRSSSINSMGDFFMIGGNPTGRVGLLGCSEIRALFSIESKQERELKTLLWTIVVVVFLGQVPKREPGFFYCVCFFQVARKIT